jgi:hypothetical protein
MKLFYKKIEDTKGVIRIRISKKNRQHNGQMKKYKRTYNNLQYFSSQYNNKTIVNTEIYIITHYLQSANWRDGTK